MHGGFGVLGVMQVRIALVWRVERAEGEWGAGSVSSQQFLRSYFIFHLAVRKLSLITAQQRRPQQLTIHANELGWKTVLIRVALAWTRFNLKRQSSGTTIT